MDNSSINPVTETEMRAFFERFATTFVNLSSQAGELVSVKASLNGIESRLQSVLDETASLRNQVQTLVAERDKARTEVSEVTQLLRLAEGERDKIKSELEASHRECEALERKRNTREEEYRALYESYSKQQQELVTTRNELTVIKESLSKREHDITTLRESLERESTYANTMYKERGTQETRAVKAESEREVLKARLAKVQAIFTEAQAPEEFKADITHIPQASATVEAPKVEEEPWWKQNQRNSF